MGRVMTQAKKAATTRLWEQGRCTTEIAAELGVHLGSIRHYLKSRGVTVLRRKPGGPGGGVKAAILAVLERDINAKTGDVAAEVGCDPGYVRRLRSDLLASLRG